ncbi:hypothetical protein OO17_08575 [Rhodopseudomonas palustris]|uniref:Uncharacterized protein n=1 Tax=Rhodopseudomonas palustris TaxID=1076 RepID=A0A0D7EWM0_RHOPL|nr:hypothetical protein OO17_08575 [Rhodopseudomonas palustris]
MIIVIIIAKIAAYTFVLNVVLRQTYNFVFLLWKKPVVWAGVVASLSIANMLIAYGLSWNPGIVSSAVIFVLILNWPPTIPKGVSKADAKNLVNQIYEELGIKKGRAKYRFGLLLFMLFSLVSYAFLFGEFCTIDGKCTPLLQSAD